MNNPEEKVFFNTIKPIKYNDVEVKTFYHDQITCPRQRKLFQIITKKWNKEMNGSIFNMI